MNYSFEKIWLLIENHGGVAEFYKEECERLWAELTEGQQERIYCNIREKLKAGKFVHYNPVKAIQENLRARKVVEPPFLHGDEKGDLVQVRYNGLYKICTRETMQQFNLEFVRDWLPYVD